jgi:glycosyltransferase involved in cell wall biosynthesis
LLIKLSAEKIEQCINDSYELPNKSLESVQEPMVSVVTLAYNHAVFIENCLKGVLMQQTTFPIEFVIGEDCSTDQTMEIICKYAKEYPETIRIITADYNVGMYANAARCVNMARGKYIALCEGDDYWTDPYKLQKQVNFLEENPDYVICYHDCIIKSFDSGKEKIAPKQKKDYTAEELVATPKQIETATKLFRNVMNKPNNKFPIENYYDYFLNAYLGTYGKCKYLSSIKPSVYNKNSGGSWSSLDKKMQLYEVINTYNDIYRYFLNRYKTEQDNDLWVKIRLRVIKEFLMKSWDRIDPENNRFYVSSSYTRIAFKGFSIELYYKPIVNRVSRKIKRFVNFFKKRIKRIKRVYRQTQKRAKRLLKKGRRRLKRFVNLIR